MCEFMNVAVLSGGLSDERTVSLGSGKAVVQAFSDAGWNPIPVEWTLENCFRIDEKTLSPCEGICALRRKKVNAVFVALHGPYGEDGTIQGFLETAGLPYTGPGVECAAVTMNKHVSREILSAEALIVPAGKVFPKGRRPVGSLPFPFPVIAKPCSLGSSVGVELVDTDEQLPPVVDRIWKEGHNCLVEEYIKGAEYSCPVIDTENGPRPLPVIEIVPASAHAIFDYSAKYDPGQAEEIVHTEETSLFEELKRLASCCHTLFGCRSFSRTDFIVSGADSVEHAAGTPFILEVNTIPGLTHQSLLPKSAQADGIPLSGLVTQAVSLAVQASHHSCRDVNRHFVEEDH